MDMTALRALMFRGGGGGGGSGMELVKSWTYDKKLVQDGVVEAIPSYSTSDKTLVDTEVIEKPILDTDNYFYFVFDRHLTTPIYDTSDVITGMEDYHAVVKNGWIYPGPIYPSIVDPTKPYDYSSYSSSRAYNETLLVYWPNTTGISFTSTTGYGAYQYVSNSITFTASTGEFSVKAPALKIRGNTTYMTQAAWGHLTDIRYQYVLELYRTSKTNFRNYWGQYDHVLDCVKSADHKLT